MIIVVLTGNGTSWVNGVTVMTASGVSGWAAVSTTVSSPTSATIVLSCPSQTTPPLGVTGTLTITESVTGATTCSITIATPVLSVLPGSAGKGTPTLTITTTAAVWLQDTAAGLFTVTGGSGASFATPTVPTNTAATEVLTTGLIDAQLTITDTSTGATAHFSVGPVLCARADNATGSGLASNNPTTTTWKDLSGNGFDGILNSGAWSSPTTYHPGWFNVNSPTTPAALTTSSSNVSGQFVAFGSLGAFPSVGSLEIWYTAGSLYTSGPARNLATTGSANNGIRFEQDTSTSEINVIVGDGVSGPNSFSLGANSIGLNADTQLVVVWDVPNNHISGYVNGQAVFTNSSNSIWPTSALTPILFAGLGSIENWWGSGRIVRAFGYKLTAPQIAAYFCADAHPFLTPQTVGSGTPLSYTPPVFNGDVWAADAWANVSGTLHYTPDVLDGGQIKIVPFVSDQGYTINAVVPIFRDYSKLASYSGNPIIGSSIATPWTQPYQLVSGQYRALTQNAALTDVVIYTSTDLLNWSISGSSPAFSAASGQWDDSYLVHQSIVKHGTTYYCLYMGRLSSTGAIGYATSTDLLNWTKYVSNPVIDNYAVPGAWVAGNVFYMLAMPNSVFFGSPGNSFNYFTSTDLAKTWTNWDVVFTIQSTDWDFANFSYYEDPFMSLNDLSGSYELIYTTNYSTTPVQTIGTGLTLDGYTFFKYQTAVVNLGSGSFWPGDGGLIVRGNTLYLFYDITNGASGAYLSTMPNYGIQPDAVSNSGYQSSASSLSWSHIWSGPNRFLAIDITLLSANDTVTACTYGGATCTLIGVKNVAGGTGRVECWGIKQSDSGAPTAGANTIAVTISGSLSCTGTAVSYVGVDQTTATETFNSASAINVGAADATVAITTVTDNCWVHAALMTNDTSVTAGQTTRNNVTGAAGSGCSEDSGGPVSPAGATTMSYTGEGTTASWAIAGYGIRPTVNTPAFIIGPDAMQYYLAHVAGRG